MWPKSRKWRAALLTWLIVGITIGGYTYRNSESLKAFVERQREIYELTASDEPIRRDLALGRIRPGSRLRDLETSHIPTEVYRHERLTFVQYGHGFGPNGGMTQILAKDGRLVTATTAYNGKSLTFFELYPWSDLQALNVGPVLHEYPAYFHVSVALAGPATFGFKRERHAEQVIAIIARHNVNR